MWHVGGTEEFIQGCGGAGEERDQLEDICVEERRILKLIFNRWTGEACSRFIWWVAGTQMR